MGATLATLTLKVLYHDKVDIGVTVTQYSNSTSDLEALVWESIITFILVLIICGVATDHRGVLQQKLYIINSNILIFIYVCI